MGRDKMNKHTMICVILVVVGFFLMFIGIAGFTGYSLLGRGSAFSTENVVIAFAGVVSMIIGVTIWTHFHVW